MPPSDLCAAHVLAIALLLVCVGIFMWDWYAAVRGQQSCTVSHIVWEWSRSYPLLPLLIGCVIGHIFWRF